MIIKDQWRLDALLGVGGMASVYAATHRDGSRVALKILHTGFARDAGIRERFLREGYVANKIEHRGRVAILADDITEQGEPFLVMELLEGETVHQLWERKGRKLTPVEALWIAAEVLDTLQSFHERGIIHRDLKPANIFITREGAIKILDFGVARMRDMGGDGGRAGLALGTPSFMAPEQAIGLSDGVDGRADIFSMGATLFAMLGGRLLHDGRSDSEAHILAATTAAPSLMRVAPELPGDVIRLVDRALAWEPRNRFQTAIAMRAECLRLIDLLGGGPPWRADELSNTRVEEQIPWTDAAPVSEAVPRAKADAPMVHALTEVFHRLELFLSFERSVGARRPETESRLRAAHRAIVDALRIDPTAVHWTISPYAFAHRGQTVWEPGAPLDAVPYHLFAAGLRRVQLTPGLSEAELHALCEVMLINPATALAPEDDIVASLWEKRLEHVRYDALDLLAEGDAAEREAFWVEADELEAAARDAVEARARETAAPGPERSASSRATLRAAGPISLGSAVNAALGAQLAMNPERWRERFFDIVADALLDARRHDDLEIVTASLAAWARALVLARRFDEVFSMFDAIGKALAATAPPDEAAALEAELTRAVFSPEALRLMVREATGAPAPGDGRAEVDPDAFARALAPLVAALGPGYLDVVLELVSASRHEGLRAVLFGYIERNLPGHEAEILDRLMTFDVDTARPVLRLFSPGTPSAAQALGRLAERAGPGLRCEATALLATKTDALGDELSRLVEGPQSELRLAALRTIAYHRVTSVGPTLARRAQDAAFHQLPLEERRELFTTLYRLQPDQAEAILIEVLQRHGLITTDEPMEQTRALAAALLGEEARSPEALHAVLAATKRRWWNSQPLRDAAVAAAEAIAARMGKRLTESGDIS